MFSGIPKWAQYIIVVGIVGWPAFIVGCVGGWFYTKNIWKSLGIGVLSAIVWTLIARSKPVHDWQVKRDKQKELAQLDFDWKRLDAVCPDKSGNGFCAMYQHNRDRNLTGITSEIQKEMRYSNLTFEQAIEKLKVDYKDFGKPIEA